MRSNIVLLALLILATLILFESCAKNHPDSVFSPPDKTEMVLIPAGDFIMGADKGIPDAAPAHTVRVDSFRIDKYEVTNAAYKKFIDATGKAPPYLDPDKYPWAKEFNWNDGTYPKGAADKPVVLVSWEDASSFAAWRGCRLPTEAEWEKAARGTDERIYPWGQQWDSTRVWCRTTSFYNPKKAKETAGDISPYGIINMSGNVAEWCRDYYDKNYYALAPKDNPLGPNVGSRKVVRGGSWQSTEKSKFRTFYREAQFSSTKTAAIGFRCVKENGK